MIMAKQSLICLQKPLQEIENMTWALYVVTFMIIAVWMQGFPSTDKNDIDPIAHPELTIPLGLVGIANDVSHFIESSTIGINKGVQDSSHTDEWVSVKVTHH